MSDPLLAFEAGTRLAKEGTMISDDLREYYQLMESGDAWGDCMGAWFAVAAELYVRGSVPENWRFRPGSSDPREPDDCWTDELVIHSDDDLIEFGNVLCRYSRMLRNAGHDY